MVLWTEVITHDFKGFFWEWYGSSMGIGVPLLGVPEKIPTSFLEIGSLGPFLCFYVCAHDSLFFFFSIFAGISNMNLSLIPLIRPAYPPTLDGIGS